MLLLCFKFVCYWCSCLFPDVTTSPSSPQILAYSEESVSGINIYNYNTTLIKLFICPANSAVNGSNHFNDLQDLVSLMPHFNSDFINAVYQTSNLDFAATFDCLFEKSSTLEAILALMKNSTGDEIEMYQE